MGKVTPALLALTLALLGCSLWQPYAGVMQAPALSATPNPTQTLEPTATETPPASCRVSAAESLNLRAGPGVGFDVLGWLSPGDLLTIQTQRQDWAQVVTPTGAAGWVNLNYCKIGE